MSSDIIIPHIRKISTVFYLISGSPAIDDSKDKSPATAEALSTSFQFTSHIIAEVPIVAIAVCAVVLTALTAAALSHFKNFSFIFNSPF